MRAFLSGWISLSVSVAATAQCPPDWSRAFLRLDFESAGFDTSILKPLHYGGRDQVLLGFTRTSVPGGLFGLTLGGPFLWDGSTLTTLGEGISAVGTNIHDTVVWIDPKTKQETLIVAGSFTSVGDVPARYIAQWNGAAWTTVGNSVDFPTTNFTVRALAVYDDGQGPALYAGGDFSKIGGVNASRIARWSGGAWEPVGSGVNSRVFALQTFDDGSGAKLFAGGEFTLANGSPAPYVARWNGAAWSSTGAGAQGRVVDLEIVNEGGSETLYAAGRFSTTSRVGRWTGDEWLPVGAGLDGEIFDLFPYSDGSQSTLLIAGDLVLTPSGDESAVAVLRQGNWEAVPAVEELYNPVATGLASTVDPATGEQIILIAGRLSPNNLALVYMNSLTVPVTQILGSGLPQTPRSMVSMDDGLNPGRKTVYADGISRLVGGQWESLPRYPDAQPYELIVAAPGGGQPLLFAAGDFDRIFGSGGPHVPVEGFAAFDGADWFVPGGGFMGYATALAVDAHETVYVGAMIEVGDEHRPAVFAYDGETLSELPGLQPDGLIDGLIFFDSGSGAQLYAIGRRLAGDEGVARWNGAAWVSTSIGSSGRRDQAAVVQDKEGAALYVSHSSSSLLMKFNGESWSFINLSDSNPDGWPCYVSGIAAFNDGSGEHVYLSGKFSDGSNPLQPFIAYLDDGTLTFLARGAEFVAHHGVNDAWRPEADQLFAFTEGEFGPDTLLLSGDFTSVAGIGAHTLAGWRAAYSLPGDINGNNLVDMADLMLAIDAFNSSTGSPDFNPDADVNDDGSVNFADLNLLVSSFNSSCP